MACANWRLRLVVFGAAVAVAVFLRLGHDQGHPAHLEDRGSSQDKATPTRAPDGNSLARVEAKVRGKNEEAAAQRRLFLAEGWRFVSAPEPDREVLELRTSALRAKPREIQVQLQSTQLSEATLESAAAIAQEAPDPKTRAVAIEALGRSEDARAQRLLADLFVRLEYNAERSQILAYIRPRSLEDATARFLVGVIADPGTPESLREQAAFPLVMLSLSRPDGAAAAARLVPQAWRNRFLALARRLRANGMPET